MTLYKSTVAPVMEDSVEARTACKHGKHSGVRTTLVKMGFAAAAEARQGGDNLMAPLCKQDDKQYWSIEHEIQSKEFWRESYRKMWKATQ